MDLHWPFKKHYYYAGIFHTLELGIVDKGSSVTSSDISVVFLLLTKSPWNTYLHHHHLCFFYHPLSQTLTVMMSELCLLSVRVHGGRPMGLTGFLSPIPPWTCNWVTGSESCCRLVGLAQELFASSATCRGSQTSTWGWSCKHLIMACKMAATWDRATLNGNWYHSLAMWIQATGSFLMCLCANIFTWRTLHREAVKHTSTLLNSLSGA